MAETITAVLAQAWRCPASASITKQENVPIGSPSTVSVGTTGQYYRHFFVKSGADGSATNPKSYPSIVEAALGANWSFGPRPDGFIDVTYNGTGTGTITWDGTGGTSVVPRNLLGFASNISLTHGQTTTATYHPAGMVYTIGRRNCRLYERRKPFAAYATTPDGRVYGWRDSSRQMGIRWDAIAHPRDWATRATLGAACTPLYPSTGRYLTPASSPSGAVLPWSVLDFWDSCAGIDVAYVSDYQGVFAGLVSTFDVLHASEEMLMADRPTSPTQANWSGRFDMTMDFNVVAVGQSIG